MNNENENFIEFLSIKDQYKGNLIMELLNYFNKNGVIDLEDEAIIEYRVHCPELNKEFMQNKWRGKRQ